MDKGWAGYYGYTEYGYRGLEEIKRLENKPKVFQIGEFKSHAGLTLPWKIECDALEGQWEALARMIMDYQEQPFCRAVGIPRGGIPLADALNKYASNDPKDQILICDDVFTTGTSFKEFIKENYPDWLGAMGYKWVVFARKPCHEHPHNVRALFTMPGD